MPAENIQVPAYAMRVVDALEEAGFEAWVVGGFVRDALLGGRGHDVDVTTSAPWQKTAEVLRRAGIEVHETGVKHGTVTAVVGGLPVETTTYRVEGAYSDKRHPDEVRFVTDAREDLARRDFTVNAMAYHPARGLLDPFGGQEDLASGVIRAVGDPSLRFEEDALRVLRAVRFACRLGFRIEGRTEEALARSADGLRAVAQERIGQEMDGILASGRVSWALRREFDVMARALPELAPMRGFDQRSPYHAYDVLEHTARVCAAVEELSGGAAPRALRWAALLHDAAKPATFSVDDGGRGHFFGHPEEGARMAGSAMGRLAVDRACVREAQALIPRATRGLMLSSPVLIAAGAAIWLASSSEVRADRPSPPASLTISAFAPGVREKAPARPSGAVSARSSMRPIESSSSGLSSTILLRLMSAELTTK